MSEQELATQHLSTIYVKPDGDDGKSKLLIRAVSTLKLRERKGLRWLITIDGQEVKDHKGIGPTDHHDGYADGKTSGVDDASITSLDPNRDVTGRITLRDDNAVIVAVNFARLKLPDAPCEFSRSAEAGAGILTLSDEPGVALRYVAIVRHEQPPIAEPDGYQFVGPAVSFYAMSPTPRKPTILQLPISEPLAPGASVVACQFKFESPGRVSWLPGVLCSEAGSPAHFIVLTQVVYGTYTVAVARTP